MVIESTHEQRTNSLRILKIEQELIDIRRDIRDFRASLNNGWKEEFINKMGSELALILHNQHKLITRILAIIGGSTGIVALLIKALS